MCEWDNTVLLIISITPFQESCSVDKQPFKYKMFEGSEVS